MRATFLCCVVALSPLLGTANAQLIGLKTAPVAEGQQFSFYPSTGMAGVSIALSDALHDPFSNPAKASRLRGTHYFGAPTFYAISKDAGSGSTIPVGMFRKMGATFVGVAAAIQDISPARGGNGDVFGPVLSFAGPDGFGSFPDNAGPRTNNYTHLTLGHSLESRRISFAGSVQWSRLTAIDGVEQLYPGAAGVRQRGHALDTRLGVLKDWDAGHSLEAVVLRNHLDMAHQVQFAEFIWDPNTAQPVFAPRSEADADRNTTLGLHAKYERQLGDSGWRVGALVTANRISRPAIPRFEVTRRDGQDGNAMAYNLGAGVSRSFHGFTAGADAIYEPISSRTRTYADSQITTSIGSIETGERTHDNHFRYSNSIFRAGVSRMIRFSDMDGSMRLQAGAQLRSINFVLDQVDHSETVSRRRNEKWPEWTRAFGVSMIYPGAELHYQGRLITGASRPGSGFDFVFSPFDPGFPPPLAVPRPWRNVTVATHQFSVSVPIR